MRLVSANATQYHVNDLLKKVSTPYFLSAACVVLR